MRVAILQIRSLSSTRPATLSRLLKVWLMYGLRICSLRFNKPTIAQMRLIVKHEITVWVHP